MDFEFDLDEETGVKKIKVTNIIYESAGNSENTKINNGDLVFYQNGSITDA